MSAAVQSNYNDASSQPSPPVNAAPLMVYWTPDVLLDVVSIPYVLMFVYLCACGFSIGNYVGYFRYHSDIYGNSLPQAHIAFVVIGTGAFVLFSSVLWLWAAKYSLDPSVKAKRLQWGIWAIFFFKDMPLFIIEANAMVCCGWLNGYQGFVFIIQCMCTLFSFCFTWLSFAWQTAALFQEYFGSYHEATLKTGSEQVLIFTPPEAMNAEVRSFVPSSSLHRNSPPRRDEWSGNRRSVVPSSFPQASTYQQWGGEEGPPSSSRYSAGHGHGPGVMIPPLEAPLRYSPRNSEPSQERASYSNYLPPPYPSPADSLPVRREATPSPWDRRPSPPSAQRRAMMAYDTHYNEPSSPFGGSVHSPGIPRSGGFGGPGSAFVVDRHTII